MLGRKSSKLSRKSTLRDQRKILNGSKHKGPIHARSTSNTQTRLRQPRQPKRSINNLEQTKSNNDLRFINIREFGKR